MEIIMKEFIITEKESGQRLDKFIFKQASKAAPGMIYKAFRKKRVKVNGKRADLKYVLKTSDKVQAYINDEFFESENTDIPWLKLSPDIKVVFEDDDMLIIDKPSGLLSQSEDKDSAEGRARRYLYDKSEIDISSPGAFIPSLCHRIDRNTSGLLIMAKNAGALKRINEKIKNREIRKFYRLTVEGRIQEGGEINGYIYKIGNNLMEFSKTPKPGARSSRLSYRVLRCDPKSDSTDLEVELHTGRTHQIRASFAYIGHPLKGDVKYGAKRGEGDMYQALRAYKLIFTENGKSVKEFKAD